MRRHFAAPLLLFGTLSLAAGCGGRPFTGELAELDGFINSNRVEDIDVDTTDETDANVRRLREQARDALRDARVNHQYATEAWQNRKDDQAREYTRVGLIYYHAADNYATSADARVRLGEANSLHQAQRQRRNMYNDALNSERELISLLETIQTLFAQNEELRRELATAQTQFQTEAQAVFSIQEARIAQREAEGNKAPQYAADLYTQASATLARANQLYASGTHEQATETALRAVEEFRRATEISRPNFAAEQDVVLRDAQNQALFDRARSDFGESLAFIDARGIVVVLPGVFIRSQANFVEERVNLLEMVVEMARQFDNRSILVEGHTQDRGTDDVNMTLSRTRADRVQEYLLQRGIRGSRLSTAGFGEAAPRYDNRTDGGRADNDRVEVVFLVR